MKQRRYQLWTAAEDTALRELPAQGVDPRKIAIRLRRTATGVRYRLQKLGIAFPGASQPTALPAKTKLPVQKTLSYPARRAASEGQLGASSFEKRMASSECCSRIDVRPDWKSFTKLPIPRGR